MGDTFAVTEATLVRASIAARWHLHTPSRVPFPDDLAERGLAIAKHQLGNSRADEAAGFGAEVKVPAHAPAIDRLAGFLGRDA